MKFLKWSASIILGLVVTAFLVVGALAVVYEMQPPYWSQEAAGWVQAVGSIVAILVAVAVAWYQNLSQRRHDEDRERAEEKAMLRCFRADIKSHLDAVDAIFDPAIAVNPDGPVMSTFPISEDPFIMYTAFLPKLGLIENDALRLQIVETYAAAKSFIMTVRHNNELLQIRHVANIEFQRFGNEGTQENLRQATATLKAYAPKIRMIHALAVSRGRHLKTVLDGI